MDPTDNVVARFLKALGYPGIQGVQVQLSTGDRRWISKPEAFSCLEQLHEIFVKAEITLKVTEEEVVELGPEISKGPLLDALDPSLVNPKREQEVIDEGRELPDQALEE
ncbi:MAG: hypothetical protein GY937_20000 [bacterium]|nr:hypothetical protein [bacterium]